MSKFSSRVNVARAPLAAANNAVVLEVGLAGFIVGYIEGAVVGTIVFEGSFDSTDGVDGVWREIGATAANTNNTYGQSNTFALAAGQSQKTFYTFRAMGLPWVRMRLSAYTSGSATGVLQSRIGGDF